MPEVNVTGLVIAMGVLLLVLWLSERWTKQSPRHALPARKLLHVAGVGVLAISPALIGHYVWLVGTVAFFTLLLTLAVGLRWFAVDVHNRRSWGIALFPAAFLVLLLAFGSRGMWWAVTWPMLVLAIADAGAALAGYYFGKRTFTISGDQKSLVGSLTFFVLATVLPLLGEHTLAPLHPAFYLPFTWYIHGPWVLGAFAFMALLLTVAEASTSGGWDNVTVPLLGGWLWMLLAGGAYTELSSFWLWLLLLAGLAFFAYARRWLNAGGAVVAALLGFVLVASLGAHILLPAGFFFVSGSLLGRLPMGGGVVAEKKQGKPRDCMQVLSNGGVAGALAIMQGYMPAPEWVLLAVISFAISTADTWSSELGSRWGGRVIDICTGKALPRGVSGGVSWQGTLAGALGAACIGAMVLWATGSLALAGMVAFLGTAGMLVDSILGSLLQAKFRWANGTLSDSPSNLGEAPVSGFAWCNNDRVNLLSNIITTILAAIAIFFLI